MTRPRRAGDSGRGSLPAILVMLLAGGLIAAGLWYFTAEESPTPGPVASLPLPTAEGSQPPSLEPLDPTGRLIIQSIGLNVALRSMRVKDGSIDPPGLVDAYIVTNHGTGLASPQGGTIYLAMHALDDGSGPGNKLAEPGSRTPNVQPGDQVLLDNLTYSVTSAVIRPKPEVAADDRLWDPQVPGRLVIITCVVVRGTTWDNVIIEAQLV